MVGSTHNCILSGDLSLGLKTILGHGHDDEVRTLISQQNGQFLSLSHDKWIRVWDINRHAVIWQYKTDVREPIKTHLNTSKLIFDIYL